MYYQNETDQTLVMLTLAGEQQAYEALVTRYQKTVIAAAASVTKNYFMAEDAAQDAFVTAWMKLNLLQDPQKFAPWVCRIAKNCAINMITRYRGFMPYIKRLSHWLSLCAKKPTVGFFDARNLRFLPVEQAKIVVFSHKAKTTGVSHLCIYAFDSPPMTLFSFQLRIGCHKLLYTHRIKLNLVKNVRAHIFCADDFSRPENAV